MKPAEPPSEANRKRWDTLTRSLTRIGVVAVSTMGLPSLKLDKRVFCALFGNALLLKLDGHSQARALALEGATVFADHGLMKDWVVVPDTHFKEWGSLTASALTALATTAPAKPRPPKKWPGQR
jgi:hypothetical protein